MLDFHLLLQLQSHILSIVLTWLRQVLLSQLKLGLPLLDVLQLTEGDSCLLGQVRVHVMQAFMFGFETTGVHIRIQSFVLFKGKQVSVLHC